MLSRPLVYAVALERNARGVALDEAAGVVTLSSASELGVVTNEAVTLDVVAADVREVLTELSAHVEAAVAGERLAVCCSGSSCAAADAIFRATVLHCGELLAAVVGSGSGVAVSVSAVACGEGERLRDLLQAAPGVAVATVPLAVGCSEESGLTWFTGSIALPASGPTLGGLLGRVLASTAAASGALFVLLTLTMAGEEGAGRILLARTHAAPTLLADAVSAALSRVPSSGSGRPAGDADEWAPGAHTQIWPEEEEGDAGEGKKDSEAAEEGYAAAMAEVVRMAGGLRPGLSPASAWWPSGPPSAAACILADWLVGPSEGQQVLILGIRTRDDSVSAGGDAVKIQRDAPAQKRGLHGPAPSARAAAPIEPPNGTRAALVFGARLRQCTSLPARGGLLASHRRAEAALVGATRATAAAVRAAHRVTEYALQETASARAAESESRAAAAAMAAELEGRPPAAAWAAARTDLIARAEDIAALRAELEACNKQRIADVGAAEARAVLADRIRTDEWLEADRIALSRPVWLSTSPAIDDVAVRGALAAYCHALRSRVALLTPDVAERTALLAVAPWRQGDVQGQAEAALTAAYEKREGIAATLFPSVALAEAVEAASGGWGGERDEADPLTAAAAAVDLSTGRYLSYRAALLTLIRARRKAAEAEGALDEVARLRGMVASLRSSLLAARAALSDAREEREALRRAGLATKGVGTAGAAGAAELQVEALMAVARLGSLQATGGLGEDVQPAATLHAAVLALRAQTVALHARCQALGAENMRLSGVVGEATHRLRALQDVVEVSRPLAQDRRPPGRGDEVAILPGPAGELLASLRAVENRLLPLLSSHAVLAAGQAAQVGASHSLVSSYEGALAKARVREEALREQLGAIGGWTPASP